MSIKETNPFRFLDIQDENERRAIRAEAQKKVDIEGVSKNLIDFSGPLSSRKVLCTERKATIRIKSLGLIFHGPSNYYDLDDMMANHGETFLKDNKEINNLYEAGILKVCSLQDAIKNAEAWESAQKDMEKKKTKNTIVVGSVNEVMNDENLITIPINNNNKTIEINLDSDSGPFSSGLPNESSIIP